MSEKRKTMKPIMLCTICNVVGMTLGIKPPPMLPWLGGWFNPKHPLYIKSGTPLEVYHP